MRPLEPLSVPLDGTQLVEASAGTGKTHTITTLYVRLLLERELSPENILVVTFTNAATAELKDRIRARTRAALLAFEGRINDDPELLALAERRSATRRADAARLREALRSLDEASVFTIHGFCQRVLAEHAFESGVPFGQELVAEQLPLLLEVVQDFWSRELYPASDAEIRYLLDHGGFNRLLSLAKIALYWPDTPVIPEARGVSAASAVAQYVLVRARAAELWPASRAPAERQIRGSVLRKNLYAPETVTRALEAMDRLCARSDESLGGWDPLCVRLAQSYLEKHTNKGHRSPEHPFFAVVDELVVAHDRAALALEDWVLGLMQRLVRFVREEMPRRKAARGVQSFDDLLHTVSRALCSPLGADLGARLRERYAVALVDEFQDTDPVQYAIFRGVFSVPGSTLFLIGDPKQAIYAFRGADVFAYLAAARDAGESAWTLATNWRSDPSLVRATNTVFGRLPRPFLIDEIGFHPVTARPGASDAPGTPLEILFVPRALSSPEPLTKLWGEAALPGLVAAHISRLLDSAEPVLGRPVEAGDIAVLTRTNDQARNVQLELRALRIASVMHGDVSVLDTAEARELARVLAALSDPADARAVRSALATTLLGLGADEIDRLQRDEADWEHWMDGFSRWHSIWLRQGFVQAFRRMMRDTRMSSRLLGLVDGDRRLTNVLHLVELLHQEASRRRLGMAGLMQWFEDVRFDRGKREGIAAEAQQVRLERDDRAVQLTTMHRSKGLEYPIVYCPFLWTEGGLFGNDRKLLKFHDPSDALRLKIDVRAEKDKKTEIELAEREARSESLRLAYVALTRAKHRSIVCWGAFRQKTSPLGHLLHSSADGDSAAAAQKLSHYDDARLLAELDGLTAASGGTIQVREIDPTPGIVLPDRDARGRTLSARTPRRKLVRLWRTSSFSALAATEAAISVPALLGKDVDEQSLDAPLPLERAVPEQPVSLHAFPRGARAGDLIHHVLEHVDFAGDQAAIGRAVEDAFDRHGFDVAWRDTLVRAIQEVLETPLAPGMRLRDVGARQRISELEFVFPVSSAARPVTAAGIAAVIERHRPAEIPADYPERVARLGFEPLAGFLRGFIDLVFEHEGRFFVADYKSNHLGARPDDYRAERIGEAMSHHHYHLQYLIYCVAVHRWLALRSPGYDFESSFGGVHYLFLRGMHPSRGAERGVFFSRPSRALIEGLSALLGGGPP